jgi:peptidoglycan/xylan/chitin deacetylase (PgdA/CDA1 family)
MTRKMKKPRDRIDYSAIVDRDELKLPDDNRIVVWPIVNIEEWEIDRPMPRTLLPAPTGVQSEPDIANWTWYEYGMRVGFWRLFEALVTRNIIPTLSINGRVCETYPRVSAAARDAGWEFMGHSYIQMPIHKIKDEEANLIKTLDAIEAFTAKRPVGWLGPGLGETYETPDLLTKHGIRYTGDWVFDDEPCILKTDNGPLVTVPYTVELNDIPLMIVHAHQSPYFSTQVIDTFDRLYLEGEARAKIMAIAVHPYVSGVPHRIKYLEQVLDYMAAKPGVLFWTGEQIYDWFKSTGPQGLG